MEETHNLSRVTRAYGTFLILKNEFSKFFYFLVKDYLKPNSIRICIKPASEL